MAAFNKVILIGNISTDVELKQTPSGVAVTNFNIAVSRPFKKDAEPKTDFFSVVAWRNTAEFIAKYFQKGKSILVEGSLQTRSWEDGNGQKRYATDVVADAVYFVSNKSEDEPKQVPAKSTNSSKTPYSAESVAFEEMSADDSLPF